MGERTRQVAHSPTRPGKACGKLMDGQDDDDQTLKSPMNSQ